MRLHGVIINSQKAMINRVVFPPPSGIHEPLAKNAFLESYFFSVSNKVVAYSKGPHSFHHYQGAEVESSSILSVSSLPVLRPVTKLPL